MEQQKTVAVELNEQQRRIVDKVRQRDYPDRDLADFIRHGFREWAAAGDPGRSTK